MSASNNVNKFLKQIRALRIRALGQAHAPQTSAELKELHERGPDAAKLGELIDKIDLIFQKVYTLFDDIKLSNILEKFNIVANIDAIGNAVAPYVHGSVNTDKVVNCITDLLVIEINSAHTLELAEYAKDFLTALKKSTKGVIVSRIIQLIPDATKYIPILLSALPRVAANIENYKNPPAPAPSAVSTPPSAKPRPLAAGPQLLAPFNGRGQLELKEHKKQHDGDERQSDFIFLQHNPPPTARQLQNLAELESSFKLLELNINLLNNTLIRFESYSIEALQKLIYAPSTYLPKLQKDLQKLASEISNFEDLDEVDEQIAKIKGHLSRSKVAIGELTRNLEKTQKLLASKEPEKAAARIEEEEEKQLPPHSPSLSGFSTISASATSLSLDDEAEEKDEVRKEKVTTPREHFSKIFSDVFTKLKNQTETFKISGFFNRLAALIQRCFGYKTEAQRQAERRQTEQRYIQDTLLPKLADYAQSTKPESADTLKQALETGLNAFPSRAKPGKISYYASLHFFLSNAKSELDKPEPARPLAAMTPP